MTKTEKTEEAHQGASVALWRAVITQAIADACGERQAEESSIQEAREWILGNSRDFHEVCALALLEPDKVSAFAQAQITAFAARPPRQRYGSSRIITHAGKSLTLEQWAHETGVSFSTLVSRLRAGMTTDQVLSTNDYRKQKRKALTND